ncbi:MAG: adenylate/guanylate cyclase domain-containing protein [Candidatus Baltobacteraceae bacterium]
MGNGLPTGTVTFVFSDIEGSTQRWEADPPAMTAALRRHDALVRASVESHGGYVFKTIGDAFCSAFQRAPDALGAALHAQRALGAEDFTAVDGLRIRMSVHTGETDEREGDYFGAVVNRVARLLAIAHGGQVLVSGATAALLRSAMPPQSELRDLGEHRLKDLAQPERVYQLVAADLRERFPALRSLDGFPNNLPRQLTSFVGREDVVAEIVALLACAPLVTLVGTGGAGKTRAALQVGADLLDGSGGGVWLVEFAPLTQPTFVAAAVAQALGLQESPTRPLLETVLQYLRAKRMVLVFDNCEHVIDEARNVAAAIVRSCAEIRILATSREALNVPGERVYRIPSLTLPPQGVTPSVEEALEYGAVRLFVERARATNARFALTPANVPFVVVVCRRLDGIPLALELAAARVRTLPPQQLAQRLDERFRLLTGGDRTALPRQQTMRALIDWSYDLLPDDERAFFRRLSIFAGTFSLESASVVTADATVDEIAALDLLSSLVDKSLVQGDVSGDDNRYRLLESTRQYAREKLIEREEYEAVARAHARAYLAVAEEFERTWALVPDRAWAAQVEPNIEDFRAALEWALGRRRDVETGQRLTVALRRPWLYLAAAEGWRWIDCALDAVGGTTPPGVVAGLELARANLGMSLTRHKLSLSAAERALACYHELDDPLGLAQAQSFAGSALVFLGEIGPGEHLLRAALDAARNLGAKKLVGLVLQDLAIARQFSDDVPGARALYGEALQIFKEAGAERQVARVAAHLADTAFRAGDAEAALRLANDGLAADRALNGSRSVANDLSNMAAYLIALHRWSEARTLAREALALAREAQADIIRAYVLQHLAAIAGLRPSERPDRDDHARAARLLGYVDGELAKVEGLREYTEQQEYDLTRTAIVETLGQAALEDLMAAGRALSEERAAEEALRV